MNQYPAQQPAGFDPNMQQAPGFDQGMQQSAGFDPNMQQAPVFDQNTSPAGDYPMPFPAAAVPVKTGSQEPFEGHHVYGKDVSMEFKLSQKVDKSTGEIQYHSINIDCAKGKPGGNGPANRSFDWADAIRFQFMTSELPVLAGVLLGFIYYGEFRNHGVNSNKSFTIEHQGKGIYLKIYDGDKKNQPGRNLPMGAADATYVAGLVLRQIQRNMKLNSVSEVIDVIRQTVGIMEAQRLQANPPRRRNG